jgi:hypothetical protein
VKNRTLWIVGAVVVLGGIGYAAYSTIFVRLPQPPVYANYVVLEPNGGNELEKKGWDNQRRERYYQTSQGSLVFPWTWFQALEWRNGTIRFASPAIQASYGLLPDSDPKYNKDQMPVGIVRNIVQNSYVENLGEGTKEWASISCAACHTGQLLYKGNAMRIDGGQSFWNFDKWSNDMVFSLMVTTAVPAKFARFCARVNHPVDEGKCSSGELANLRKQVKRYFDSDLIRAGVNALLNHTYPTEEGFTRTSALGRGVNGEFMPLDPCHGYLSRNCNRNVTRNTGPVSFPPLWYTHDYDWVQSTTAIRQPLGRNLTESWGVSVRVDLSPGANLWSSTHNVDDMFWMETMVSVLQAPKWPENILGPINWERVERGRKLFNEAVWPNAPPADQAELPEEKAANILGPNPARPKTGYCARCHAPAFEPDKAWTPESTATASGVAANVYDHKFLQLPLYRQNVMGTDPDDAQQFHGRRLSTGELNPLFTQRQFDSQGRVGIGDALWVSINGILDRWFKENDVPSQCREIMEGHRQNLFRAPLGYPARPLDGYWSTGPFLHNGSIRTLYELLAPVSERDKSFWIGSREYDPVHLGYANLPIEGAFLYDTSLPGNSNKGHEFRDAPPNTEGVIGPYLTPDQRLDILEYLKVMRSVPEFLNADPATKDRLVQRYALLDAMSAYYERPNWTQVEPGNRPQSEGGFNRKQFCQEIEKAAGRPVVSQSPTPKPER